MSTEEFPSTHSPVAEASFTDFSTATATQAEVSWQLLTHAPRLLVLMDDRREDPENRDGTASFFSVKHASLTLAWSSEKKRKVHQAARVVFSG